MAPTPGPFEGHAMHLLPQIPGVFEGHVGRSPLTAALAPDVVKPRPPRGPNTGLGGLGGTKPFPGGLPGAFGGGKRASSPSKA